MRKYKTGATRDTDSGKLAYTGFLSPMVLKRYAEFMQKNRLQKDGKLRDPDNWKRGIPKQDYMDSLGRHFMEAWENWDWARDPAITEEALCGVMFNAMGLLYETLLDKKGKRK